MISVVRYGYFRINVGNLLGVREINCKGRSILKVRNVLILNL